jgi:hypothetical protein
MLPDQGRFSSVVIREIYKETIYPLSHKPITLVRAFGRFVFGVRRREKKVVFPFNGVAQVWRFLSIAADCGIYSDNDTRFINTII